MAYIKWKDEYLVNVEPFDSQHKRLISLINTLYDQFKIGKTHEELNTFNVFMEYAMEHFSAEETILLKYNFPALEDHKVEHKVLRHVLRGYQSQITKDGFTMELFEMLKHWLLNHIVDTDKKYGVFLNENGIKVNPE